MQFHPQDLSDLDELTEEHLGFSALSDGLGFSKQSKKAPQKQYDSFDQPLSKSKDAELQRKAQSGIGAIAAGPVRPAPSTSPAQYQFRDPMIPPSPRPAAPVPAVRAAGPTPARAPSPLAASNVLSEPAAPQALRVAAFAIDFLIIFVPTALAWKVSFHARAWSIFRQDIDPPLFLFCVIFGAYFLLSESFGGQSLGKMILNLRVVEDDKYQKPTGLSHAAKRLFLFAITGGFLGVGFLASFWDSKRRPWHDRYSGSIVRQRA
jgi:uncharacterized RDD family membrane protein YckC